MSGFQLPAKSKHSFSWLNTLVKCEVNTHLPDGLAMNFMLHHTTSAQTKTTAQTTAETTITTTETETTVTETETTESVIPYSRPTLTSIKSEDLLSLSSIGESEILTEEGQSFVTVSSLNHASSHAADNAPDIHDVEEFVTSKCSIQKNNCLLLSKEHLRETIILSDVGGVMRPFVLTSGLDNGILHVFIDEDKSIAVTLHNHTTTTFIMKEVNIESLKVSLTFS